jgi:rfaE bifunctional protein kinase chain/domain
MNMNLNKIFSAFTSQKVMVIGDVMVDSYIWGKVERISPEAPVPVVSVTKREERLGGAANVVLNLHSLGAQPILCSVVGKDRKGKEFCNLLDEKNITTKGILALADRVTTTKFRVIGNNVQMLRVDEEVDRLLNSNEINQFFIRIKKLVEDEKPSVIIFEDYDKGVVTAELIDRVVELAKKNRIPVTVDPKKINFNSYKDVTLFKPNFKELCDGLKIDTVKKDKASLSKICRDFQQRQHIEFMLLTLSEHGVFYSFKNKKRGFDSGLIPAEIRTIADVSGAGDTVIAVSSLCLAIGIPVEKIATIANIAGGMVCEKVGVVPIDKKSFLEELKTLIK